MRQKKFYILFLLVVLLMACGQAGDTSEAEQVKENNQSNKVSDNEVNTNEINESNRLSDLKVHYIDAGQADATLFQYTDQDKDYTILYDTGDWNKTDVLDYLAEEDISLIDLIVISHPHADHIGQMAKIINTYGAKEVWMTANTNSSGTFEDALEAVIASGADYHEPLAGEIFDVGSLRIEVLHPSELTGDLNKDSLSLRFTYGDTSFLFTGDAYIDDELQMMELESGVAADVLQLGHHGSNTSSHPDFIEAVDPNLTIYSAGNNNSYGHPHVDVVADIQNADIPLYGTDVNGTIIVTSDGQKYSIETEKEGEVQGRMTETSKKDEENKKEGCVDINNASANDLQTIKHIGPARAEDVIKARPFNAVDDLAKVKGIGPAGLDDIINEGNACVK